jgi:hypothetical protein
MSLAEFAETAARTLSKVPMFGLVTWVQAGAARAEDAAVRAAKTSKDSALMVFPH